MGRTGGAPEKSRLPVRRLAVLRLRDAQLRAPARRSLSVRRLRDAQLIPCHPLFEESSDKRLFVRFGHHTQLKHTNGATYK